MKFEKVRDSRQRAVRGLWKRRSIFYAKMRVEGKRWAVRIPLRNEAGQAIATVPAAVLAMQALKAKKAAGAMPQVSQADTLRGAIERYSRYHETVESKRAATLLRERSCFGHLLAFRPEVRLNRIQSKFAHDYAVARQAAGASGRAVDLEIVALRNVLRMAKRDGDLQTLPDLNWTTLAAPPKKVRLLTPEEIEATCAAAGAFVYGEMFVFFLRLLAYSGGREQETLRLRWEDVDFKQKQLTIGRAVMIGGELFMAKNEEARVVDFNPRLEEHLTAMSKRRQPGTAWLFPSPRAAGVDKPVFNFHKSLATAVRKAGVVAFGFHHLRHYFISHAVMAGIDTMTIAKWVGHKDGGVLIGKVYGHLNNAHTARQAQRLSL